MNWWETVDWQDPINRDCPLNAGIVGWWMGAPGLFGGTRLWDLCNKNHGTLTNMDPVTAWKTSERGPVLEFDGVNDHVKTLSVNTATPFAVFQVMSSSETPPATTKQTCSHIRHGFSWGHSNASFRQAAFLQTGFSTFVAAKLTSTLAANTTYAIGYEWTGAALDAYLNGIREATTAAASYYLPVNNSFIGCGSNDGTTTQSHFAGRVHCQIFFSRSIGVRHFDMVDQYRTGFPDLLNHVSRRMTSLPPQATFGSPWYYHQQQQLMRAA